MADALVAALDHVAVAVSDPDVAVRRWIDQLGGGRVSRGGNAVFASQQIRYANGARLELLAPAPHAEEGSFVRRFLERFGSTVHHMTLKVPDLLQALEVVVAGGLEPVDVRNDSTHWQEAFLRPSQVGGLVVQIACSDLDEDAWAALTGFPREDPRPDAASLLGPRLRHPDLDFAASLWTLLGATVAISDTQLECTWPDSPLSVVVEQGSPAGPVSLRMRGADALPAEAALGPALEVE